MVKTSTLAIILAALIISIVFTAEADGAGLVKRAISTVGTWAVSDIPNLPASKITSGTFPKTMIDPSGTFPWSEISKTGSSIHDLANVTSVGCAVGQILKVSGTTWQCTADSGLTSAVTSINADATAAQTILAVTGNTTVSTTSGATTINLGTNVVTTGDFAQTITKGLTINSGTLGGTLNANGNILDNIASINDNSGAESTSGFIDMANAVLLCWEASPAGADVCFSVDATEDIDFTDTDINFVDLGTNPLSFTETTDPANPSNTQGNLWIDADPIGSTPKWKSDSRVEYPLAGIPQPPYKWGELIPQSATAALIGLMNTCSAPLATASFGYDTAGATSAINSTTAATDGTNGGISCVTANTNVYRGDQNAYMYSRFESNKTSSDRIFIGFTSSAIILPNNADTILDNLSGAGLCIRTTDTIYQFCSNAGDATTAYASLTTTQDTGVHYFEVYSYDEGTTWCGALDGGTPVCSSTAADIPAPTTRMYVMSSGETDGGVTGITWTQYLMFTRNDQ